MRWCYAQAVHIPSQRAIHLGRFQVLAPHQPILDALDFQLQLRAKRISNAIKGVLLEGPSGIGKSTLGTQYLMAKQIPHTGLTPTDLTLMEQTLTAAFHVGEGGR